MFYEIIVFIYYYLCIIKFISQFYNLLLLFYKSSCENASLLPVYSFVEIWIGQVFTMFTIACLSNIFLWWLLRSIDTSSPI